MISKISPDGIRVSNRNKKGGSPEDSRQKVNTMEQIMEVPLLSKQKREIPSVNSPDKNASVWLNEQIMKAQSGIVTQVVDLTPALARVLLARNPDNRAISNRVVESYARDMSNGAWSFNGEPVIISKDGHLNDGQHRCEAVIASGMTISVILVIGPERDTRMTVDQGKARRAGDYLGMSGHVDSLVLAATAKYVWQVRNIGLLSTKVENSPTKGEILSFVEEHSTLIDSVAAIGKKGSDAAGGRSVLAFAHWVIWNATGNKTEAHVFIQALVSGHNLGVRSPILYARNRLMSERGRLKVNEKAELIYRAWNAYRRGDKVASLPIKGGPLPVLER